MSPRIFFSRRPFHRYTLLLAGILAFVPASTATSPGASVMTLQAPKDARLPRAVIDAAGTVHLIFVRGEMKNGNLLYARHEPGESAWSTPEPINSQPETVTGVGPIDGGQIALSGDDRLHVVWFQMSPTRFFYTRSSANGPGFEPQRSIGTENEEGVEAGPAVAADELKNIYVFWHAGAVEDAHRAVSMTVSHDGGTTFNPPRLISAEREGACMCCSLAAATDEAGTGENIRRGLRLLTSHDGGQAFSDQLIHPWRFGACPVSTTAMSGTRIAWETNRQIYMADVDQTDAAISPTAKSIYRRKNPAVAVNHRGETLLVWGDGLGWKSGGTLHWQLFDAYGQPMREPGGGTDMIPDGSVPTAIARPDGTFLIIF